MKKGTSRLTELLFSKSPRSSILCDLAVMIHIDTAGKSAYRAARQQSARWGFGSGSTLHRYADTPETDFDNHHRDTPNRCWPRYGECLPSTHGADSLTDVELPRARWCVSASTGGFLPGARIHQRRYCPPRRENPGRDTRLLMTAL